MRHLAALALVVLAITACGGSSDGDGSRAPLNPRTASPLPTDATKGVTTFAQTVPDEDGFGVVFPGQANTWVLNPDFSLGAGFGNQYSGALALHLGNPAATLVDLVTQITGGSLAAFPDDQAFADLTFLTPTFSSADGVRTVALSSGLLNGTTYAALNGTSDSRLSRQITLDSGPTGYTVEWTDDVVLDPGALVGGVGPRYQVVLRDPTTGEVLQELYSTTTDASGSHDPVAVTIARPATVDLSFEVRSAAGVPGGSVLVDDVHLKADAADVSGFTNGDFEASDLTPWQANASAEPQNVRSASRSMGGLDVTRTFYTKPASTWARVVDVFENPGDSEITTSAVYYTRLAGGSPYAADAASGKAVVGWDAGHGARDVGIVSGDDTRYFSANSADVVLVHPLTVPAHAKVALVHFVVQLGRMEGGAVNPTDLPSHTMTECATVAGGWSTDEQYSIDLEPGVRAAVANF